MKKLLCISSFVFGTFSSFAQAFSGTPANIRWRQIKTDTARIIYPAGEDSLAQRVAALIHYQQRTFSSTIGNDVHRISIVLRNELTYFNGYVALGPYRSEYYLTTPQNAFEEGAQSVTDLLSIHEYRHVEQYNNFRKGLSKVAYYLFGQNGQALANDASIPNWFFEGDAVYNETLLSKQGRGRLPNFFNGYKALFYEGKRYSYMKLRNGSYKSYVPDHYPLGYMLVSYGRERFGDDFWRTVTDGAVRFKPLVYPLQTNVKASSGLRFKAFVNDAFSFYQQQWERQKQSNVSWLTATQKRNVIDYRYPYSDGSGGTIVLKRSYKTLSHFYHISADGKEEKIALQNITNDDYFSYNNNKIVYAIYQPDVRWAYRQYSVIKLLDVATKKEQTITRKTRYFSPDISHDGKRIAAVSLSPQQHSTLDVLDLKGKKITSLANKNNEIYSYPKFAFDDKSIFFCVRKTNGEMSLQQWDLQTERITVLLPFANHIIGFPQVQGDTLLYSCSNGGKDEIWAFVFSTKTNYRLANYQTGLYGGIINKDSVTASVFTSSGYRLGSFAPQWQPVNIEADTLIGLYVKQPFHQRANQTLTSVPTSEHYITQHYPKLSNPFNFHSLQPDYSNPIFSLTLYGNNILNTIQNQVYYNYNQNENYHQIGYNITYGASYIQPFIDVSETFNRSTYNSQGKRFSYNELRGIAGLQLPLNFSCRNQYRYLTATAAFGFSNPQFTGSAKDRAHNFANGYVQTQLLYSGARQQALQNIYPHWAQRIFVQYRKITSSPSAQQFLVSGSLFLPSFSANHSIVLDAAYQTQTFQHSANFFNYSFPNNFPFSRGYAAPRFPAMYKSGINYHLPLAYPDFGFANLLYVKRIRANLFFDWSHIEGNANNQHYQYNFRSTGTEIFIDTRWWNQQDITVGLRYSRLLDYNIQNVQSNQWTLILPTNIF